MNVDDRVKFGLPPEDVMDMMRKIAIEQATEMLAQHAEQFAKTLDPKINGQMALLAFASSIRATNAKRFPPNGTAS